LSAWFQARVLRLPIEVPIVPRRRVALFTIYAAASGAYSYLLLFVVVRLSYRLGSKWLAEFALIPAMALAFTLFRGRLRSLRRVMTEFWKEKLRPGLRMRPLQMLVGLGLIVLLFVPLWRDREGAFFVIEPAELHAICAAVPGRVNGVLVQQGQSVRQGQPLLRMTSYLEASMRSGSVAQTRGARFKTFDAQLQGQSVGSAIADENEARRMTKLASEAQTSLELTAPADGIILTDYPPSLVNQDVGYGQPLLELAGKTRIVRIFIPTTALSRISANSEVALSLPGQFSLVRLKLLPPSGDPVSLPVGIIPAEKYRGIGLPVFYSSRIPLVGLAADERFGVAGQAKIFGERQSVAGRAAKIVSDLVKAHVW